METGAVTDVGGKATVAAAVASVAGLVDELARVVRGPMAAPGNDSCDDTDPDSRGNSPHRNAHSSGASDDARGHGVGSHGICRSGAPISADPLGELAESCLAGLEVLARVEAAAAAAKVRLVAAYAEASAQIEGPAADSYEASAREKSLVAEVACVLTVGERAASALLGEAHALTNSLPAALDELQAGAISWQHARILADETAGLEPDGVKALETHFFDPDAPHAARGAAPGELVPSRFRRKVRAWRERQYPDSLELRRAMSMADRRMEYRPLADGMAQICLILPGETACAIWNKATAIARGLQNPDDPRTLSQRRVDVSANLLLGCTGQDLEKLPAPKADVLVTVPVFSLFGATDEPGEVDGYGPVPASVAQRIVAEGAGSFYRVLVDPSDGAPLEIGRTNYRLPESLKRWLRMRDGKCTFPGCCNHTQDNENDHLIAWQHGGATGISNLAQLCPKHHRLKHQSPWTPTPASKNEPPGWTSPTGRHYPAEQPDWVPPRLPLALLAGESTTPPNLDGGNPVGTGGAFGGVSPLEDALVAYLAA
ncbi:DUF222 domain-containing protein [Pseudarthrobacter sp. SL88]|uniref:HNH endonuclease signature motif containing protein n=1 Tax=Pseudarthrobacter sp. SL88 TaxID=2994666 RepID=UPI0022729CB3|nr:HNH endonuclease signature motif containing protein [Pseudarthrobacter sp. SL88]MCY1673473.1 DUF222 domain-containing protein [Pseudarthrobacter sp. SL88]